MIIVVPRFFVGDIINKKDVLISIDVTRPDGLKTCGNLHVKEPLCDIAPTITDILGINRGIEWEEKSLINKDL